MKYVTKIRKYVPTERRHGMTTSFKHGVSVIKRPMIPRTGVREIVKKPMPYGKLASQAVKPVKKIPPRKPENANVAVSALRSTKVALVKKVEEKRLEPPSVEPTPDGHYELSPMLSKMVELELQDVMTKVWELRPTNPHDAAEKIVADRFRNNAGKALQNTLGLNITKRLLNVHNPLYVKIVFSGKPLRADLIAFLKKYNISAFKRVGERGGTFAAKMRTFQDFDDLCIDKNLMCGKIHVTVTPCYQFMACPPNLRTRYDGKESNIGIAKPLQTAVSQETSKPAEKGTKPNNASQQSVTPKPNQANTGAKVTLKVQTEAKIATKITPTKVENKPAAKAVETKSASNENVALKVTHLKPQIVAQTQNSGKQSQKNQNQVQEKPKQAPNETPTKTIQNTVSKLTPKTNQAQKATPVKVTSQNAIPKVTPAKATQNNQNTAKGAKHVTSQIAIPKVTPAKATQNNQNTAKVAKHVTSQNAIPKVTPAKAAQNNQNTAKVAKNAGAGGTPLKLATPNIAKVAISKPTPAKIAGYKPKVATKAKVPPKKKQSDYDELNDHDILALISEGIVLDECSGSDID